MPAPQIPSKKKRKMKAVTRVLSSNLQRDSEGEDHKYVSQRYVSLETPQSVQAPSNQLITVNNTGSSNTQSQATIM